MNRSDFYPVNNAEHEVAVLAGILRYEELRGTIFSILSEKNFIEPFCKKVFVASKSMYDRGEPLILAEVARRADRPEGEINYLYAHAVLGCGAEWYAQKLIDRTVRRELIDACLDTAVNAGFDLGAERVKGDEFASFDPSAAIDSITARVKGVMVSIEETTLSAKDIKDSVLDEILNPTEKTGILTGLSSLDGLSGPLYPNNLVVIGARPGVGKSMLALTFADNMARAGKKVALFSLEMSHKEISQRQLSFTARVDLARMRNSPELLSQGEKDALRQASYRLNEYGDNIMVDTDSGLTPAKMRQKLRSMRIGFVPDCIIVDYLQLMRPDKTSTSREVEVASISKAMKGIAMEFKVPVITLAQLNRKVEDRDNKTPSLSDLRESGSIEQDADIVLFISRDKNEDAKSPVEQATLIVAKNRNGRCGAVNCMIERKYTHFVDIEHFE